jgi:hypothetical protein
LTYLFADVYDMQEMIIAQIVERKIFGGYIQVYLEVSDVAGLLPSLPKV